MQKTLKATNFTGNWKYEVVFVLLPDSVELLCNLRFLVLFQSKVPSLGEKKKKKCPGHLRASKEIFHSTRKYVSKRSKQAIGFFFQCSGILISKAFAFGSLVKMKCFPYVWWLLSLNCLLLLSSWLTKDGFCRITFQQVIESAGEGGEGCQEFLPEIQEMWITQKNRFLGLIVPPLTVCVTAQAP